MITTMCIQPLDTANYWKLWTSKSWIHQRDNCM